MSLFFSQLANRRTVYVDIKILVQLIRNNKHDIFF